MSIFRDGNNCQVVIAYIPDFAGDVGTISLLQRSFLQQCKAKAHLGNLVDLRLSQLMGLGLFMHPLVMSPPLFSL